MQTPANKNNDNNNNREHNASDPSSPIGKQAELFLLQLARETMASYLQRQTGQKPAFVTKSTRFATLNEPRGAFVTLHEKQSQALRGCIGSIEAEEATIVIVQKMAIAAATRDPRFAPLSIKELDHQNIEISLLEAPRQLDNINELTQIMIGRDGLIIEKDRNRGLLLPQVASERNWDWQKFFEQTLIKTGLSPEKESFDTVKTFVFSAYHFAEENSSAH